MDEGDREYTSAEAASEHPVPERLPPKRSTSTPPADARPVLEDERFVVPGLPYAERQRSRRVSLDTLVWALILIWVGALLLAANFGLLDWFEFEAFDLAWRLPFGNDVWSLIFLGIALLVGAEILVRLLVPSHRRNVLGYVILVIVFASLGLGLTEMMWPMILVAVGIALLLRGRGRR
jgi:hypothetical protein